MKVEHANDISKGLLQQVNNEKGPQGGEFKSILEQKMAPQPLQDIDDAPPPSAPEMIPDVQFRPPAVADGHSLIQQAEDFLDTMEAYQQELMNPDVNLKQMSPLIDKMRAQGEDLSASLDGLPSGDGMQDILTQMLITSSLEVIRFNRGDYVG
jgi:hypothetical protein